MPRDINFQTNPSAAVMIYNYRDRLGSDHVQSADEQEIDQIVLNTVSLISVSTSKSKMNPTGEFTIELAPTKNWVSTITPGSWCVILMGRSEIPSKETKYNSPTVNEDHFKMIGRIQSVRAASTVDQNTGAITTKYIVTGTDWGEIFNTVLYVDPMSRPENGSAIGSAMRLLYENMAKHWGESKKQIDNLNSTDNIKAILSFWGIEDPASSQLSVATQDKTLAKSLNRFSVPDQLAEYMRFTDATGESISNRITEILRIKTGVLTDYDEYSGNGGSDEEHSDGIGLIQPRSLVGNNTVWQLLNDNCNKPLNELVTDVRFENGKPNLTVYKRVRPFKIHDIEDIVEDDVKVSDSSGLTQGFKVDVKGVDFLTKLLSDFKNVRRHSIPKEDVLSLNAGTNWRDRYNFVEVNFGRQLLSQEGSSDKIETALKEDLQFFDHTSIRRDGLMPMSMNVNFFPPGKGRERLDKIIAYKYFAKEWYFDTHKMLNGAITLVGQDKYIGVGDNIMFPVDVLTSNNNNFNSDGNNQQSYVLAHVESVSHTANVSVNGARNFTTEIQFVRGILTDANAEKLDSDAYQTIDNDASDMTPSTEKNADRVFGTSSGKNGSQDPDVQKLRGT